MLSFGTQLGAHTNKEENENRENEEVTALAIKLRPLGCHMTSLYLRLPWRGPNIRAETLLKAYGKSRIRLLSVKALT